MKTYRTILIDPKARTIRELNNNATLATIHEMVGAETLAHFGLAKFKDGEIDTGWVDDGGMARGMPIEAFLLPTTKDPIAGKCLIIGADRYGETSNCLMPMEVLRQGVVWLGLILPEVTWDHTEFGSRAIVTYSKVKM